ncbi:type I pullulanase [Corynebacterium sp. ES2794-CONJ1]|uniref:type I pullulanase n=1 Tax=unclassified Corynebacterium TaxID=2624378 RepID=UPI00216ABBA8|nr:MULTISPECIES: type I pullulanase [unclassified Corynebacterium]MCS4531582.1 type I pullulanase [Corynebacterium sp. ES2730-CONJ]MCU9518978.1 type I pullulanase [Corynebacterium sp. ES2794-CONJ1]
MRQYPHYDGQLGALYTPSATTFRLWAPTAATVTLYLRSEAYPMTQGDHGEWETICHGDFHGAEYHFGLSFPNGTTTTSVDPYARSVTINGKRGVVVDVDTLLGPAQRLDSFTDPRTAIIYEAHIRDLTIGPNNGITHKGAFLGLSEAGTRTTRGNLSGLDYLSSLGVTHIQLLPIFDFGSVDEAGDLSYNAQYNWGYDPENYNAPEGSYATIPGDPLLRLTELKKLIDALHARGLRVIMDVVYNHVYEAERHPFELTVPGYYFRTTSEGAFCNATGCGNETASERSMMRKYIVDSVLYWARTFGLDGFRFDLMGIHDVDTMNAVRRALDTVDEGIIIIGEGWEMGNHSQGVRGAHQGNAALMPGVGMFNDFYRDVVKGSNFIRTGSGFISGASGDDARKLFDALNPLDPSHSVVYNEAHDNWTMYDKLRGTTGLEQAPEEEIAQRHTLATLTQYLARGMVFLHAGQEFLRTKGGDENSYKSPDSVNEFDYDRAQLFAKEAGFVRHLNTFRKKYSWTYDPQYLMELMSAEGRRLSYRVNDAFGPGRHAIVMLNGENRHWLHPVTSGAYRVHINQGVVFHNPAPINLSHEYVVGPLSGTVLECVE